MKQRGYGNRRDGGTCDSNASAGRPGMGRKGGGRFGCGARRQRQEQGCADNARAFAGRARGAGRCMRLAQRQKSEEE